MQRPWGRSREYEGTKRRNTGWSAALRRKGLWEFSHAGSCSSCLGFGLQSMSSGEPGRSLSTGHPGLNFKKWRAKFDQSQLYPPHYQLLWLEVWAIFPQAPELPFIQPLPLCLPCIFVTIRSSWGRRESSRPLSLLYVGELG